MTVMAQDTNINLCLIGEDGTTSKGLLKMQHNNGNVSLSFFPELIVDGVKGKPQSKRIAQIPDCVFQLSDFTMIEMDAEDRLVVTLSGSRSHCVLYFTRDNDITHFLNYIGGKVRLKNSDCNPRVYLLEPLDSTASIVTPFSSTALPQSNSRANKAPSRVSLHRIQHPDLLFQFDQPVKKMTSEEYYSYFDEEGKIKDGVDFPGIFYNVDVDLAVAGELWKLLLEPDDAKLPREKRNEKTNENRSKYIEIKRQWQATTPRQWKNYGELRDLVALLEKDLNDNINLFQHFQSPAFVQKIAFNVLLTLSYWNWDNAAYVKDLIHFLAPFLDSFIMDANKDSVKLHDGTIITTEESEADIFWCFTTFYDHNNLCDLVRPSTKPLNKPLFIAIGFILQDNFPDLLQLLNQKHAFSLDFLRDDVSSWFTTCYSGDDLRRLWVSVLSFSSSFQFFQCYIVSLLYSLAQSFVEMNPLNSDEFVRRFHVLKKNVDLNLLLHNTAQILKILQKKTIH